MKHSIDLKLKAFAHLLCWCFAISCMSLLCGKANAQDLYYRPKICYNYGGEWSQWYNFIDNEQTLRYGDGSGFTLRTRGGIDFFTFRIDNYTEPNKIQKKYYLKHNLWYEYTGYVEYYVNDTYPTAEAVTKANNLVKPSPRTDLTPSVLRHAKATIKVAPYKKNPYCYNIYFDNTAIALSFYGLTYGDVKLK